MAKDRRKKQTEPEQTLLMPEKGRGKNKKRKKKTAAQTVVKVLVGLVTVAGLAFLIVLGKYLFELFAADTDTSPGVVQHETTDEALKNKMAYYLVGLLGPETGDDTEGLMLLCHDKASKKVEMMQIPRDTYLGNSEDFAVKYIGGVWSNPKPLTWCETCRGRVYEPEIEEGKHTVCDTELTQKTGSSVENLIDVFNEQYSMPIDGYFMFPTESFAELVDALGGVTVKLENSITVGDITYKSGVSTLDGEAAVVYMTEDAATVTEDIERLLRQRRAIAAVLQRLFEADRQTRTDIFTAIMVGKHPIRTDVAVEDMAKLLGDWAEITPVNMTVCVAPGEAVKSGSKRYYSLHSADLLKLLNERFNPHGQPIEFTHLKIEELRDPSEKSELYSQTLAFNLSSQERLTESTDEE